jgi:Transposase zinc-binding domain
VTPPALEIADLIRTAGAAFVERNRQWIRWKHVKVLRAIARCRTAALGGHLDECTRCAHRTPISYNSCRDRHCPKCQTAARERWIAARRRELLPTRYLHVVFTLPRYLAPVVLQNKKVIYDLLLRASAETLLEVARDPTALPETAIVERKNVYPRRSKTFTKHVPQFALLVALVKQQNSRPRFS